MSNEIVKVKREMPTSEMLEIAKLFVESKMFDGMNQVAQAFVKIKAGAEIGLEPFQSMSGIYIIKGKTSIGANLIAGCVQGSGKYTYKVLKIDNTICSIEFFKGKESQGISTFTISDAKAAQTQNLEKFPRNMLFARAISNGCRWYSPDVFTMPVYTPEELGDPNFTEDIPFETGTATQGTVGEKPTVLKKNTLNEAKYKQALEAVKVGAKLPNSETSFYTFLTNDCELTTEQLAEVEAAYKPM